MSTSELPTCACTALARRSFTNTGRGGDEWWVCNQCGYPTAAWLTIYMAMFYGGGDTHDHDDDDARPERSV